MRFTYLIIVLLAALTVWQTTQIPPSPVTVSHSTRQAIDWSFLPEKTPEQITTWLATLNTANPWGIVARADAQKASDYKPWKFVGVVNQPSDVFVLIRFVGQAPEPRRIGEELPGGGKIKAIKDDHLCLLVNGVERRLDLYQ